MREDKDKYPLLCQCHSNKQRKHQHIVIHTQVCVANNGTPRYYIHLLQVYGRYEYANHHQPAHQHDKELV